MIFRRDFQPSRGRARPLSAEAPYAPAPDGGSAAGDPERRAGSKAVNVRWAAYCKAHPDKLKAKLERENSKATRGTPKKGRRR